MSESVVKAKAYWGSRDNVLLVANRDFGERKYFNVKMNRQFSLSKKGGTSKYKFTSFIIITLTISVPINRGKNSF